MYAHSYGRNRPGMPSRMGPSYAAEFGLPNPRPTQIQSFIERCCDPSLEQMNLSLALELADYINTKRANTAREAAFEIVQRVNSRVSHVGILALDLLDILVKNCGYLIHLQIGTKEFLNEMVRRFPERPPMHPGPVMTRILEMIHEWRQTICVTSKHKEDLVHIRDMHRLLMYKGYRFPKIDARSAAVLSTNQPLQSPEELEEETRLAQSAKLQELIRRGTPRDLQQAQELMKILSGADPESNNVQTRQIAKEMDKIESRAKLLVDMLDQANPSDKFVSGDAYDQVASSLRSVQPRLQKWIEQAEDDEESRHLNRFLQLNDMINQTLDRYDAVSHGRESATKRATNSLISFDDDAENAPSSSSQATSAPDSTPGPGSSAKKSIFDEFESLSFGNTASTNPSGTTNTKDAVKADNNSVLSTSNPAALLSHQSSSVPSSTPSNKIFDLLGDIDEPSTPGASAMATTSGPSVHPSSSKPHFPHTSNAPPASSKDPFAGLDLLS